MFTQVMDTCLKATHIVPESEHIQTLRSTVKPKASRVAGEGTKITRGLEGIPMSTCKPTCDLLKYWH